jgi:hypothetical protein
MDFSRWTRSYLPTSSLTDAIPGASWLRNSQQTFRKFFGAPALWVVVGELIVIAERVADRSRPARSRQPAFFFDPACPFSYLACERVERILGDADWIPAASILLDGLSWAQLPATRREAEQLAAELRLPLVWPDRFPAWTARALRAAVKAIEVV